MTEAPELAALNILYAEVSRIRTQMPSSRWYLSGSITTDRRPVGDIDLLGVCETSADCAKARSELASLCEQFPVHLLLMTVSEEAEVSFIQGQDAVEITRNLRIDGKT